MPRFVVVLLIVALAMTGCAVKKESDAATLPQRTGSTELENVQRVYNPPPGGLTAEALPPEYAPVPVHEPLPEYPPEALPSEIACTAYILYHTEMDGSASFVRIDWTVPPPDEHIARFEAAIERAVESWEFEPAYKLVPTEMEDGAIEPVRKTIRFAGRAIVRFLVVDGVGIVAR